MELRAPLNHVLVVPEAEPAPLSSVGLWTPDGFFAPQPVAQHGPDGVAADGKVSAPAAARLRVVAVGPLVPPQWSGICQATRERHTIHFDQKAEVYSLEWETVPCGWTYPPGGSGWAWVSDCACGYTFKGDVAEACPKCGKSRGQVALPDGSVMRSCRRWRWHPACTRCGNVFRDASPREQKDKACEKCGAIREIERVHEAPRARTWLTEAPWATGSIVYGLPHAGRMVDWAYHLILYSAADIVAVEEGA